MNPGDLLIFLPVIDEEGNTLEDGCGLNYANEQSDSDGRLDDDFWVEYENMGEFMYIAPQNRALRPCGEWHICLLSLKNGDHHLIELHGNQFILK